MLKLAQFILYGASCIIFFPLLDFGDHESLKVDVVEDPDDWQHQLEAPYYSVGHYYYYKYKYYLHFEKARKK